MKLPILMSVLLTAMFVGATESVLVMKPLESGPEVRIVTLHNGKGMAGVRVEIFQWNVEQKEKRVFMFVSEDGGWLKLPTLVPGEYHIVAVLPDEDRAPGDQMRTDLLLNVSSHSRQTPTLFPMELTDPVAQREEWREKQIAKAEQMPVAYTVKEFRGTVYDLSGAPIPSADLNILRKGTKGKETIAVLKTDNKGEFQPHLPDGEYFAEILSPGFETRFFRFQVSSEGKEQLTVTLRIAPASEEVSVAQTSLPPK